MTDQGEKECSTPRKPKNCIVLYCTRIVYLSSNAFLSLRGRHKKGRGGEGRGGGEKRKREKGKRAFPSLINNLFHSSVSLTDDACHILSPSV